MIHAVVWERRAVDCEGRIGNVLGKIGRVFDRLRNTVWIITREESLSSDKEQCYLWSPVSRKVFPRIRYCLWIKGWLRPNYRLCEECLEKVNKHQIKGGQKSFWLGLGISVQHGPSQASLGIASGTCVVGLRCVTDYSGYWLGPVAMDLYRNQQHDF